MREPMESVGDIVLMVLVLVAGAVTFYRRRRRIAQRMTPAKLITLVGFALLLAGFLMVLGSFFAGREPPLFTPALFVSSVLCLAVGFAMDFSSRKQ